MAFIPALLASFLPKIVGGIGDVIESVASDVGSGEVKGLGDLGSSVLGGIGKAVGFPGMDQAIPIVKQVAKSLSETPQKVQLNNLTRSKIESPSPGIIRTQTMETQPMFQAKAKQVMDKVYMHDLDPEEAMYREFQAFKRFKQGQKKVPQQVETVYEQQL
jgi:hypothetical protein